MQSNNDFPFSLISKEYYGFQLLIPDPAYIKEIYQEGVMDFPFWSRVWASAMALSEWIIENPGLVIGLDVMEIGAGIGLPSFVCSLHARKVMVTDQQQFAVDLLNINIALNRIQIISTAILDWRFDQLQTAEIYLMSDVNYEPQSMIALQKIILKIIESGAQICIATPQRLSAIAFVEFIQPFILSSHVRTINGSDISLYHLAGK